MEPDDVNMNKTLVLTGNGGYDKLQIQYKPMPKAGQGEVLVKIKATGINFAELMARAGMYDRAPKCPCVLGLEAAGVVIDLGPGVSTLKVGDRVMLMNNFELWTEHKALPETNCFVMPDDMTFAEAAAIPVNYITAHMMLFDMGNLRPNKSVLIHMAAGGVGVAATQLCQTVENVTIFGTASKAKHETIKGYGVTHPIDYRTQDYEAEIKKVSPKGVDIVLDPLSGNDSVKGFKLLKPMGRIIHFGAANMVTGTTRSLWQIAKTYMATKNYNPLGLMPENKMAAGYHLGYLVDNIELIRECAIELLKLYTEGKIKPVIDSQWSFEEKAEAMARMHERKNIGKVILCPNKPEENDDTVE